MEVTIHSNIAGAIGVAIVSTDHENTIGSLIKTFCREKGIPCRSEFVLVNCRQEILQQNKKLSLLGVQNGEELYLSVREPSEWPCNCNQWWILAFVTFCIGTVGIIAVSYIKSQDYLPKYAYCVGLDAGSSHTNLYVYRWPSQKYYGTGVVEQTYSCSNANDSMKPISSFVSDPSMAGKELVRCLDAAESFVPKEQLSLTPVFLGATAGMRLLQLSNRTAADAIMGSVKKVIVSYRFYVIDINLQVRIIDGVEEGTFSWIATNFLSGKFGFQPMARISKHLLQSEAQNISSLLGALDMGGASTQITYLPQAESSLECGNNKTLNLYGSEYNVYTYSYLCYGFDEAYRRLLATLVLDRAYSRTVYDPCSKNNTQLNYTYEYIFKVPCSLQSQDQANPKLQGTIFTVIGTSDTGSCRNLTLRLFNFSAVCNFPSCSFDGVFQPSLFGSYLAFSGFYNIMKSLNLTSPTSTLSDFTNARDSLCTSFSLVSKYNYCFQSHFVYDILIDGYKFNETSWADLKFAKQVNGVDLGWIIGMIINATTVIPAPVKSESFSLAGFIIFIILFCALLIISMAFVYHARRNSRSRGDQYYTAATAYGAI